MEPVRGFSWSTKQGHRPGLQFMVSTGRHHGFESLEERAALLALDFLAVSEVLPQPFELDFEHVGGRAKHTPDFLALMRDGGLHSTTADGWTLDVISPEWPNHRVLLSADGGMYNGPHGEQWWHVCNSDYSTFRAAGFAPSGRTLAVATSSDLTLWTRPGGVTELHDGKHT